MLARPVVILVAAWLTVLGFAPAASGRVVADVPQSRGGQPAGPAIAGSLVVWAQRRGTGWQVYAAASRRGRRSVGRVGARVTALAASSSHVAVAAGGQVLAGRLRGPLRAIGAAGPGAPRMTEDGRPEPSSPPPADPGCGRGTVDATAGVALAGSRLVVADTITRCDGQGMLHRVVERDLASPSEPPQVLGASADAFDRVLAAGAFTGWTVITDAPASTPSVGGSAATRSVDAAGRTVAYVGSSGSRYGGPVDATALGTEGTLAVAGHAEDSLDSRSWVRVQRPGGAPEQTVQHESDQGVAYTHLALRGSLLVLRADAAPPRASWLGGGSERLGARDAVATSGVATDGRRIAWVQSTSRGWRVRLDPAPGA